MSQIKTLEEEEGVKKLKVRNKNNLLIEQKKKRNACYLASLLTY